MTTTPEALIARFNSAPQRVADIDSGELADEYRISVSASERVTLIAALSRPAPPPADMRAFGANEKACYLWPEDSEMHKACRAAYCQGAYNRPAPAAEVTAAEIQRLRAALGNIVRTEVLTTIEQIKDYAKEIIASPAHDEVKS